MSFSELRLFVPGISESSSITELISFVRSSFRKEEYDEVQRLLISREEKMKMELSSLKRDYELVTKDRDLLEEKHGLVVLENLEIKEELKKWKHDCEELTRQKRDAEEMVALRDSQLMDFDIRVSNLEALAQFLRVDVEDLRTGAFQMEEGMDEEVLPNGVKLHVSEGQNKGLDVENLHSGVNSHVEGEENGGLSLGALSNEMNGHLEDNQALEPILNGLLQFARSSTRAQGTDLPNEEATENGNDNGEASSGALSTFDCPRVASNASDLEENDEYSDTDLNDKDLLQTKVGTINGHNVVLTSRDIQVAYDAPQAGSTGFHQDKGKKMPMAAAFEF